MIIPWSGFPVHNLPVSTEQTLGVLYSTLRLCTVHSCCIKPYHSCCTLSVCLHIYRCFLWNQSFLNPGLRVEAFEDDQHWSEIDVCTTGSYPQEWFCASRWTTTGANRVPFVLLTLFQVGATQPHLRLQIHHSLFSSSWLKCRCESLCCRNTKSQHQLVTCHRNYS